MSPGNGKSFCACHVWNYNATALRHAVGASHVNLSIDGVRVGGEETLVGFGFLPDVNVASVLPCQARRAKSTIIGCSAVAFLFFIRFF